MTSSAARRQSLPSHSHSHSNSSSSYQSSSSNDIMSPTPYNNVSTPPTTHSNNTKKNKNTNSEEADITNDDLEAMKAMIGDIKKDPSLLYRLSSLSGSPPPSDNRPAATTNNNNNHGPSKQRSIHLDDHTEVSSIGMMSSDDYSSYPRPPSFHGEFSTTNNNNSPQGGVNNNFQMLGSGEHTPNQSRTHRDAEIALRMQSLRAMRDWNKQQQVVVSPSAVNRSQPQQQQQGGVSLSTGGAGKRGSPITTTTTTATVGEGNSGGGGGGVSNNNSERGDKDYQEEQQEQEHQQQQFPSTPKQSRPPPIESPTPISYPTSRRSNEGRGSENSRTSEGGRGGGMRNNDEKSSSGGARNKNSRSSRRKDHGVDTNNNGEEEDDSDEDSQTSSVHQLQQQQEDERALRRISEVTTETEISNFKGTPSRRGDKVRGSPRGSSTRSSRSASRSSRKGSGSSSKSGRPENNYQRRSASQGAYVSGSRSVHEGYYHPQQQQHQSSARGNSKSRSSHHQVSSPSEHPSHGSSPRSTGTSSRQYARQNTTNDSPSKHSFHESSSSSSRSKQQASSSSQYGRRNTTNDVSSPSKHSFHEASSSTSLHMGDNNSRQYGRREQQQQQQQQQQQGLQSRSYDGPYDSRAQQQHSHPPQDNPRPRFARSRSDLSAASEDRSYQVNQLAKLYARGETPDKGVDVDGRGDGVHHGSGESVASSSRMVSSSYEEEGSRRHHHRRSHNHQQQSQQGSSDETKRDKQYSMNDVAASATRYNSPQKQLPKDDNLEVNAKAKSISMIITNRDAEESMSPQQKSTIVKSPSRKSKKSSSKKSSTRGSEEKKHRSKKSKSKVQDVSFSEVDHGEAEPSETMGLSLRSSESGEMALSPEKLSSPEKQSSFHKIRRFHSAQKHKRRTSNDFNTSSSSASVMNRISNPLRSFKSPTKDVSQTAHGSSQSGSSDHHDDHSETQQQQFRRRLSLESTEDHDSPQKHRKSKLMSRLVSSPTSQLDNCGNSISIADDDDEHAVSMGIELALMTGEVPRLCDAKGRCLFHPHIRLQKPKLFGGWKILFKHCPDCAVEHMRATQDKMAERKKKKRREKKSSDKRRSDEKKKGDPIIAMNVGDDDFTPKKNKKKKKKYREDGERKEEVQESEEPPLALPAPPAPPREEYRPEMSDAITRNDQSYNESHAIVEHKPPRSKKVNGLPWSDYNGQSGRYTGEVNEQYLPHGRGEMVYDKGVVSAGIWYDGVLDTEEPVSMDGYVPHHLPNYEVGDKGVDEDMIITSKRETAAAVAEIRVNDAAFVRRSDGSWTYAVVKDRVDDGRNQSIRFKVNSRGSTKSFPPSQWGTYIRCVNSKGRSDAPVKRSAPGLGEYLDSNNRRRAAQPVGHSSSSLAGNFTGYSGDVSVSSTHSAPVLDRSRSTDNLTTAKMRIRSRSRSRGRKNVTTLPLLFSSSMSVSEETENDSNDEWETASGSGYRLRGIDP